MVGVIDLLCTGVTSAYALVSPRNNNARQKSPKPLALTRIGTLLGGQYTRVSDLKTLALLNSALFRLDDGFGGAGSFHPWEARREAIGGPGAGSIARPKELQDLRPQR